MPFRRCRPRHRSGKAATKTSVKSFRNPKEVYAYRDEVVYITPNRGEAEQIWQKQVAERTQKRLEHDLFIAQLLSAWCAPKYFVHEEKQIKKHQFARRTQKRQDNEEQQNEPRSSVFVQQKAGVPSCCSLGDYHKPFENGFARE